MRVESPKPAHHNPRKQKGDAGRYSFWNTKRSEQKTPASSQGDHNDSNQIVQTPKQSNEKLYVNFEEVKGTVSERAETEVKGASGGVEEKLLLSKSERKLNKPSQKSQYSTV